MATSPDMLAEIAGETGSLAGKAGVLPRQDIRILVKRGMVRSISGEFAESQYQPASLDLRLGHKAYRVRASFLPGPQKSVAQVLGELTQDEMSLENSAILEKNCVYVVELMESLEDLPATISAFANPKSSTGRLDVFTRLIADRSEVFDTIPGGYSGKLYAEISPSSFSIRVRKGSRLNQLRFRRRGSMQEEATGFRLSDKELQKVHDETPLVDGPATIRNGLVFSIHLAGAHAGDTIGYQAQRYTDVIDVDRVGAYAIDDFWTPITAKANKRLILDPHQFYILASKEKLHIPSGYAAEMAPIDPTMGEFRVHYAGFFDPGFGVGAGGMPGSRGVLEVRSHEVPFVLEDGQVVGRLAFERMAAEPDALYGAIGTSNYQGQALKLSKHFKS
ncbi:2'-deoxycytidine 5'-triphosphate deaminase [Bosea sp. (in: a-proteobacteria)]|uniref:2'-deoxycytidine 5'-triphosphate deaminase n=1 Tax=Bosea sp. (in: a-proteobacteria) TaxID=1871050 RepID=UPI00262CCD26|nr:2'-deoxycytidine 5'-triphosphate deaminase [Bosea sp. (in: a-proteobacteria)]MCO5090399.1 2'-deoxycytidine 5'-triphosphate deaminase [Bosea sp. (in: a-proteobacteria)]